MSGWGQTLHFDHVPRTSGPPRTTDIAGPTRLVRSVPILLQKSAAVDGLPAIELVSTGFDPPTQAALRNLTLRNAQGLSRRRSCD